MTYPLTYVYLLAFVAAFGSAVAVAISSPIQPAKRSLVAGMAGISLWALASFLSNLATTSEQMEAIGDLFAISWCLVPYLMLRAARQYVSGERRLRPLWAEALLLLPGLFSFGLELTGAITAAHIPASENGGAFDVIPTAWQLFINVYFLSYCGATGLVLWRGGQQARSRGLRRTAFFFLLLALPGVVVGSWSTGGLLIVDWRPPYLDAVLASLVVTALGWGMMREIYFKPRRALEEAWWNAEDRLRGLLTVSPDCLAVLEMDGTFRLLNQPAAQVLGYDSPEAFLADGRPIDDFILKEEYEYLLDLRARAAAGEVIRGAELTIVPRGGDPIETEVSISVAHHISGEPASFIAALRDVSERRRLDEGLRQAQKLESLGLLASGIAHDFNNLLSVVLGSTDLALASLEGNEAAAANIRQAIRGAKHLSALTRELLVYSGRAKQVVGPLSLSRLVSEIGGLLEVSLPRGVALETDLASDLPSFSGDAAQIQQVVLNLITNAAEACAEGGGRVQLRTSVLRVESDGLLDAGSGQPVMEGSYLCLEVHDDGCGMSAEVQRRIFDPFFTSKVSGRGLGLSAVLGIVRDHGGYTLLESTPGVGTVFRILLPPVSSPAAVASDEAGARATAAPFRGALQVS